MGRTRALALPVPLLLLLLVSSLPARAAGTITGLTASPSPAQVGAQVTVTVQGNGSCNEMHVDFGDGSPAVPLTSVDLTKATNVTTPPHVFAAAKTYVIKAIPIKGCVGSASGNLVVNAPTVKVPELMPGAGRTGQATGLGSGGGGTGTGGSVMKPGEPVVGGLIDPAKLCVLTGACVPLITSKLGLVTPGSTLLLLGSGFGSAQGKAVLQGQFGARELKIVEWHPKAVACVIPGDIQGVPDHPASVTVQTPGGIKSDALPLAFEAVKEVKLLVAGDFSTLACAPSGNINNCNWTTKVSGGATATNEPWIGCVFKHSLCGWHQDGVGLGAFPSGTDTYELKLKNGWALHDKSSLESGSLFNAHLADEPGGFVEGSTGWKPSVKWWMNKYLWTTYSLDVFAIGPKGVPSK